MPSGLTIHQIPAKQKAPVTPKLETGTVMFTRTLRRLAALMFLLGLAMLLVQGAMAQIPSVQQIHDQLRVDKAAGKECPYEGWWVTQQAIKDAVDHNYHHLARGPDLDPATLGDCGLVQVQAVTPTPTPTQTGLPDPSAINSACQKLQSDLSGLDADLKAVLAAGGVVQPNPPSPSPPSGPTESADLSIATPGNGVIFDAALNQWQLDAKQNILENQKAVTAPIGSWQSPELVYHNHQVILKGLDGNWYALGAGNAPTKVAAPL